MTRDEMIMANHNLIYSYAKKHKIDLEEYYGLLAIALIRAVDNFDSSYGFKFSTYAYRCMGLALAKEFRKENNDALSNYTSLDKELAEDISLIDMIEDDEQRIEIPEKVNIPNNLNKKERLILYYFLQGKSFQQIADINNCSRQLIHSYYQKARNKIKEANKR